MRTRYVSWALVVLAAGIVLAGPGIRDNVMRALWIALGLAAILFCYLRLARRRPGRR